MNIVAMMAYLTEVGLVVTKVPNYADCLHVESRRESPDWLWRLPGWVVSTCGTGRVFLTKVNK